MSKRTSEEAVAELEASYDDYERSRELVEIGEEGALCVAQADGKGVPIHVSERTGQGTKRSDGWMRVYGESTRKKRRSSSREFDLKLAEKVTQRRGSRELVCVLDGADTLLPLARQSFPDVSENHTRHHSCP